MVSSFPETSKPHSHLLGLTLFNWGLGLKGCQTLVEVHVGTMLGLINSGQMTKVTASRNRAMTVILIP